MTKTEFIKNLLEPLVKATTAYNVNKLEYIKDTKNNEEYVKVYYVWEDGFGQQQCITKRICITADSLRAIAIDVIHKC